MPGLFVGSFNAGTLRCRAVCSRFPVRYNARSVTAPSDAELTSFAYFASTPRV